MNFIRTNSVVPIKEIVIMEETDMTREEIKAQDTDQVFYRQHSFCEFHVFTSLHPDISCLESLQLFPKMLRQEYSCQFKYNRRAVILQLQILNMLSG